MLAVGPLGPQYSKNVERPDTRLNLQYDKLYVNNVADVFNEDTAEIEMLNQPEVEEYPVAGKLVSIYFNNE